MPTIKNTKVLTITVTKTDTINFEDWHNHSTIDSDDYSSDASYRAALQLEWDAMMEETGGEIKHEMELHDDEIEDAIEYNGPWLDDVPDNDWEECYNITKGVDTLCGAWEDLKQFKTMRDVNGEIIKETTYLQTFGGGPEGGYFETHDLVNGGYYLYKVSRGWGEPFKVESVKGTLKRYSLGGITRVMLRE